ncbi:hypothetical protein [Pseudotabrizicola sp.]|uniref:hypothetical protein n=1 Tax=Pseudotabrizicola sp. TaxID=2939647 RepID=UPI00272F944A|nr:hypothetical protein [Pseudotabrizicola sp.]MDP2079514.1 hypothetical protein [Pseudotabrizicola sp.]
MAVELEFLTGIDPIDFFVSSADEVSACEKTCGALLGVGDSLRQARFLMGEPLGLFALLTAEEEAASFLYYCLLDKGYEIPNYGKIQNHLDKAKILILAETLVSYFFSREMAGIKRFVRFEKIEGLVSAYQHFRLGDFHIRQDDPLETIKTHGNSPDKHDAAVEGAIELTLKKISPPGQSLKSQIKSIANRRNLCLYGDPSRKPRLGSQEEIDHFHNQCTAILALGFLVRNGAGRTSSMQKLTKKFFEMVKSAN